MRKRIGKRIGAVALIVFLGVFVGVLPVYAQTPDDGYVPHLPFFSGDVQFGWSVGDIGISYRRGLQTPNNSFLFNAEVLKIFWLFGVGFSIGFDAFHAEYNGTDRYMSFLPIEIGYTAFRFSSKVQPLLYTRYEWLFLPNGNTFVFSAGVKLVAYPIIEDSYISYFDAFLEFGTNGDFRLGIGIDVVSLIFVMINRLQDNANGVPKVSGDGLYRRPPP
ncbi:MAG: hypothetical protein Ta2A_21400 [Treponemataceae bacterium]|nr:MAG: hypothetical protein Ta2A_21400 [Treponemataceae bacterium]